MTRMLISIIKGQIMAHKETLEKINTYMNDLNMQHEFDGGGVHYLGRIENDIILELKKLEQVLNILESEVKTE